MMLQLFNGQTVDGNSNTFLWKGGRGQIACDGVFAGATLQVQLSPDGGTTWINLTGYATGYASAFEFAAAPALVRLTLSGSTGSTNVSAWLSDADPSPILAKPFDMLYYAPELWLEPALNRLSVSGSRDFPGLDERFQKAADFWNPGTSDFSVSFWVYCDAFATQTLVGTGAGSDGHDGFYLYEYSTGNIRVKLCDSVQTLTAESSTLGQLVLNTWHFVVCTFDRDGLASLYIDDMTTPVGTLDISGHQADLGASHEVIGGYTGGALPLNGKMAAYGQFLGLLSAAERDLLKQNLTFGDLSADLAAKAARFWNLQERSGDAICAKTGATSVASGTGTITLAAGPHEPTARDSQDASPAALKAFADTLNCWSTDVPDVQKIEDGYSMDCGSAGYLEATITDLSTILNGSHTLAGWVKFVGGANETIFGAPSYQFYRRNSDGYVAHFETSTVTSGALVSTGTWHHFAFTFDADTNARRLYWNGVEANMTVADIAVTPGTTLWLGTYNATPTDKCLGKLDDLRIYNTNLSAADIALLHAGGEPTTAPVSGWSFDDAPRGVPANADAIVAWESSEGSRRRFIQTDQTLRPLYTSSVGAVTVNNAEYFKGLGAFISGTAFSMFYVAKCTAGITQQAILGVGDDSVAAQQIWVGQYPASTQRRLGLSTGAGDSIRCNDRMLASVRLGECHCSGTAWEFLLDGVEQTESVVVGANSGDGPDDFTGLDVTHIAAVTDGLGGVTAKWRGDIYEVVYFNRALSTLEKSLIRQHLTSKYGL
jgi:hypothetical protein